ncbi:MAG: BrnA antitoxin family protein [Patescibacteria group bacterium]
MSKLKKIPQFKNEAEERKFWQSHDSSDFVDWSQARSDVAFPRLKPSTKTISLRLPESLLYRLKAMANEQDVPYQSLIKILLNEKVEEKNHRHHTKMSR